MTSGQDLKKNSIPNLDKYKNQINKTLNHANRTRGSAFRNGNSLSNTSVYMGGSQASGFKDTQKRFSTLSHGTRTSYGAAEQEEPVYGKQVPRHTESMNELLSSHYARRHNL